MHEWRGKEIMVPSRGGSAGQAARRFRVGEVPPLAEGFTDRPETAPGIMEALAPGLAVLLVPGSAFAEGPRNWLGACGKTQLAVSLAESLWQSGAINALIWIAATSRAAVLSTYAQAYMAGTGIGPAGTAESVAARFLSWLSTTNQPWLAVLDDLQDPADLDGLWPEGPEGRLLVTSRQSALASGRPGMRVVPVDFFSVHEALSYLTGRLSANPIHRNGAIDLIGDLGREPLALAQVASVVANSTLTCRDYREYFARRRQQVGMVTGEVPPAAMVTWTLSLGQAESLLPGESVRLMLVIVALLDGHGIPGAIFNTPAVSAYLGPAAAPFSPAAGSKTAWDALLAIERVGMITVDRAETPPRILMSSVLAWGVRRAAPAQVKDPAARAAASALLEAWPAEEPQPWTAARLRANVASLLDSAADVLWTGGCHPLLLRAGRSLDGARLIGPAVEYWRDLASRCDTKLSPGHPDALAIADQLAAAYMAAGQAWEAVAWCQRVLAERGRALAPGNPTVVAARVSLARALIMAGEHSDAVFVLQRAVSECEHFRGSGHPDTFSAREELAAAYRAAGEAGAAIELLARTLADRGRVQGQRHADTIATRGHLAAACLAGGKVKDAVSQYKRVLADRERVLGHGHPDTIAARAELAAAYHTAGRIPSALELSEQCCADSERILGPDHVDTLTRRASLAHLYYTAGLIEDSVALFRDTAMRCELVLPAGDPLTRAVQQSLANIGKG
jgi:tetratricopeptide (TPR) repeat protein